MTLEPVTAQGARIPPIGLGTWELEGEALALAISAAAAAGYRHFDTAPRYGNEAGVGAALRETGLRRDAYFLTTKVWHTELAADAFRRSAEESVERIGLGPVDLLLVHWPSSTGVPLEETIAALCRARRDGLARHVGVSNFPAPLLARALEIADEPITANQCESHPGFDQSALIAFCQARGIAFTAYSPLGNGKILALPEIAAIAERLGRTPAQVVLRWHVQKGCVAIPRSRNPARIAENIAIGDFALTTADMAAIDALARPDGRMFSPPHMVWD